MLTKPQCDHEQQLRGVWVIAHDGNYFRTWSRLEIATNVNVGGAIGVICI